MSSTSATLLVASMWAATWWGESLEGAAQFRFASLALVVGVIAMKASRGVVGAAVILAGLAGGSSAWQSGVVNNVSRCSGVVTLVNDPAPVGSGVRVIVEYEDRRYAATAFGVPARLLARRSAHEKVAVVAECSPLNPDYARRERVRHVVGRMSVTMASERFIEPPALVRSANRVRSSMTNGVSHMPPALRALFTGLVVGDDRLQSQDMVRRFRESGLSHLCAASGQNVAYLLALAGPLLRRRSSRTRAVATLAIILWFVVLTRAEPSVLRAGFMAAAVALNAARRAPMNARAVLALSAMCLLAIDPMLAWSVGFALSVGATAGLAWLSAPLGSVLGRHGTLATTLAAQVGTMPVSIVVFGSVPVVSLIANPLALPVAGVVMTIGLPLSLLAAAVPPLVPAVSTAMTVPVLWVDSVARMCSHMSVPPAWNWLCWGLVVLWVWRRWHQHARRRTHVAG